MASPTTRLVRLLDRGFYPQELPPPFRTRRFSDVRASLNPPKGYSGSTTFFDGATFRGHLRTFGIINPINYFSLSRFIATNWGAIADVLNESTCSGARPKFPSLAAAGRAIEIASLASKRTAHRHLASAYPVILSLDINRFYGSIYTHSIPWAALGKDEAKRQFNNNTLNSHWSAELDRLTRNSNQRQTIGIPIGPDTSRIISEMILARVDRELTATGSGLSSPQIFHNIDDYQVGVGSVSDAENAQSRFVRIISRYELRINDFKTSIDHGLDFAPSNFERYFDVLRGKNGKEFVELFFDMLYEFIAKHPESNVAGYTLKRFGSALARNPEQALVREYLQRLILASPHQARWAFPLLLGIYARIGVNTEIRRIVHWGIEVCSRRNDVGSVTWFLYVAIFLRIKVGKQACDLCFGMSSEIIDLVLYHGRDLGLFAPSVPSMHARYLSAGFSSPAWLPLYEIGRRGWDTSAAFSKIGGPKDPNGLYAHLSNNNVEFYVTDPDLFTVEAFENWNLRQENFEPNAAVQIDWDRMGFDDVIENYE